MRIIKELKDREVIGQDIKFDGEYRLRNASRAIVFNADKKIAIMNSKNHNFHKLPGGGIEEGEDILVALNREIKEEVGAKIKIKGEVGKIIEYKNNYGQKQTSYCYIANVIGNLKEQTLTEYEKINHNFELKWITIKDAIELLKKDNPKDYTGKFIVARDLCFLKEAKKLIEI
jgi:ADP-ribose pyrophosphatase YjhB (NUDIX family)